MGWNEIEMKRDCFLFSNIKNKSHMYFIHSYEFMTKEKDCIIATTNYGNPIIVSVEKENIIGTQFHPEKSQKNGFKLLLKPQALHCMLKMFMEIIVTT